jgi:hypothetical protein
MILIIKAADGPDSYKGALKADFLRQKGNSIAE